MTVTLQSKSKKGVVDLLVNGIKNGIFSCPLNPALQKLVDSGRTSIYLEEKDDSEEDEEQI